MRITRETLLRVAQDTVAQRTRSDRTLVSIYLCGSLLEDDYLSGGTTDIDLVMVHTDVVEAEREILPLTDEVHIDIAHHYHRDYRQTRQLRIHPWLGPTLKSCKIIYDPQHFLDFTQASVRGQFERPDHVLERARGQYDHARQIWNSIHVSPISHESEWILGYLRSLSLAANAIASLSGFPLTERRFLLNFKNRADTIGKPGLYAGLLGLLGSPRVDVDTIKSWIPLWRRAFDLVSTAQAPARLNPARALYYQRSLEALQNGQQPMACLWPLLHTWSLAIQHGSGEAENTLPWAEAMQRLGLMGGETKERIEALDAYLDLIEESLDDWGHQSGASEV